MPGVRWGSDITDEAATRVREIDNLTARISASNSPKTRSMLESRLGGLRIDTASIFGSERRARNLAGAATYDGDPNLLPKSVTDAKSNTRARPKLTKQQHSIATSAGALQNRKGFGATSRNPGSAYSMGRTTRTSARNPTGESGTQAARLLASRKKAIADKKKAMNKVSRTKATAAKKAARPKKAAAPKKAAKPRTPRKPKAS